MATEMHIDIGKEFSKILGPRFKKDGDYSGQEFRDTLLEPAISKYDKVVVHLDSLSGYTPSFFEEAFGGLVRIHGATVLEKIEFDALERAYLVPIIQGWMQDAAEVAKTGS